MLSPFTGPSLAGEAVDVFLRPSARPRSEVYGYGPVSGDIELMTIGRANLHQSVLTVSKRTRDLECSLLAVASPES